MNTMPQHRNTRRGFTLAEMMVVIVIIGLLGTLVVPNVMKRFAQASRTTAKADITAIMSALEEFAINNAGNFPDSLEVLVTPDENGHTYIKGPVGKLPRDPWKNEYIYEPPQPGHPVPRILSYGKDGQPGGEGDDRDIASDDGEG
jgi:general secretion pathway protein G